MRPQILVTDRHGHVRDVTHLSIVRDGPGYALTMEVDGRLDTLEVQSVAQVELVGMGEDTGAVGSDLDPWGRSLVTEEAAAIGDADLLEALVQGLRGGRYQLVDTMAEGATVDESPHR